MLHKAKKQKAKINYECAVRWTTSSDMVVNSKEHDIVQNACVHAEFNV